MVFGSVNPCTFDDKLGIGLLLSVKLESLSFGLLQP